MAQPVAGESSDRWGSLLSRLNPVPRFPELTGPYKVGSVDVEIPVSELESPAHAPENAADVDTIQFRIFYPCDSNANGRRITWLPAPQRDYLSAYIKFLGVGPLIAEAASFLPRHLHYTSIPVYDNAPILEAETPDGRWPTMIFSHGLGGSRNAYSQIVGSLASHGVVVVCPEHRDGSAIVSFVKVLNPQSKFFKNSQRTVHYRRIPQDPTEEVYQMRNDQLRIRLWELGLIHEALLQVDEGAQINNLNKNAGPLEHLTNKLHIHEPGSIIFAGHSFGAATIVQFLKSVFYAGRPELEAMDMPLYAPNWESSICRQITSQNVTILLDMWCLPLQAESTKALFNLPLPVYEPSSSHSAPPSPGGNAILAVESEDFFKWRKQLHLTARILSQDPSAQTVLPTDASLPHFFYVKQSAHLNQSDFAVIFPWLTRKVFGSGTPVRALRLNLRALLQVLRVNGISVAGTRSVDLVDGNGKGRDSTTTSLEEGDDADSLAKSDICMDDTSIFDREGNAIRGEEQQGGNNNNNNNATGSTTGTEEMIKAWRSIDIVGMGQVSDSESNETTTTTKTKKKKGKRKEEVVVITETIDEQMATVVDPIASASGFPAPRPDAEVANVNAQNIYVAAA
ncbi:phospholipase A2 [Xylaria sp. CBS 124048]|nr:phospholipase A2 [Xylaria sp. CBS 124048]